jgi:hypothetical protein
VKDAPCRHSRIGRPCQFDGVLFMQVEGRQAEITQLIGDHRLRPAAHR